MRYRRIANGTALHTLLACLVAGVTSGCGGAAESNGHGGANAVGGSGAGSGATAVGGSDSVTSAGTASTTGGTGVVGFPAPEGGANAAGATAEGGAGGAVGVPAMVVCSQPDPGAIPSLVDGLSPTEPVDYLALYQVISAGGDVGPQITLLQESGTACSGAVSPDPCGEALKTVIDGLDTSSGLPMDGQIVVRDYFVYTRGAEAGKLSDRQELLAFLGTIDTANEAAVLLWAGRRPVTCDGIREDHGSYVAASQAMVSDCPITYQPVEVRVTPDGALEERNVGAPTTTNACVGRRPDGLERSSHTGCEPALGRYFAELSELELAAVAAFELLGRELAAHGAPASFIARCERARDDELRHTSAMGELARRFGGEPRKVAVAPRGERSLLDIALENAREGVVRELYGAAAAEWQATHARDPQVRRELRRIAREEAEHAWLSLELDAWLGTQLAADERELVARERADARQNLALELAHAEHADVHDLAGVPHPVAALRLLESLDQLQIEPRDDSPRDGAPTAAASLFG